jgi:putative transposase
VGRAVPGMIHYAAAHARQIQREPDTFWLSRLRKGPGMQYVDSIFRQLLKPIDRRQFRKIVERHDGNAYDKSFKSWDHLVTMVGAQLGGATSLRAVEVTVKANSHQHYHLGIGNARRSTLSRANARRPVGVFADTFAMLAKKADRSTRVEGAEMVRLIDSSPIPLGKLCEWAEWNGRIRGMKMHVVYHPGNDVPRCVEITPSTVNDVEIGRQTELEAGATYVFDKGYYHFGWWKKINAANAFFVTRVKVNTRLRKTKSRYVRQTIGDGFKIITDADVVLTSKGDSKLPIPLRRIKVKRDKGGTITLITNDLERTAVEIAALYKGRWQIELLFRWIKQHLNLRKFMGRNDNAIRLQIIAAMIAYLLLRLARRLNSLKMLDLRLAELVCQRLFMRKSIAEIDTPPAVNPSKPKSKFSPDQLGFNYV